MSLFLSQNNYNFNCSTPIQNKQRKNTDETSRKSTRRSKRSDEKIKSLSKHGVGSSFTSLSSIENVRRENTAERSHFDLHLHNPDSFLTKISSIQSNVISSNDEENKENIENLSLIDDDEQFDKLYSAKDDPDEFVFKLPLEFDYNFSCTQNNIDKVLLSYHSSYDGNGDGLETCEPMQRQYRSGYNHDRVQKWVDNIKINQNTLIDEVHNIDQSQASIEVSMPAVSRGGKFDVISKYKHRKIIFDEIAEEIEEDMETNIYYDHPYWKVESMEKKNDNSELSHPGDNNSEMKNTSVIYKKLSALLRENTILRNLLTTNKETKQMDRKHLRELEEKLRENIREYNEFIAQIEGTFNDFATKNLRLQNIVIDSMEVLAHIYRQIPKTQ